MHILHLDLDPDQATQIYADLDPDPATQIDVDALSYNTLVFFVID